MDLMNEYSGYGAKRVRRFARSSNFIISTMNIKGKTFVETFTDKLG